VIELLPIRIRVLVWATIFVAGCAGPNRAPIENKGQSLREPANPTREVVPGDTLYSIAWETGRDYRDLASWNGIGNDYLIKPGQKITLGPPGDTPRPDSGRNPETASGQYKVVKGDTVYSIARHHGLSVTRLTGLNKLHKPYRIYPGQTLDVTGSMTDVSSHQARAPKPKSAESRQSSPETVRSKPYRGRWSWPTAGTVIGRYSGKAQRKGIEIAGKKAQAIVSAAPGTVVYRGSGLRGYGNLIIVKHDDDYLSAYAHCENIYVKEGDVIQSRQKIAGMGDSGTNRVKLHFEIRYKGKSVDPLKFLPRR